jgi:kumamolisin
MAKIPPGHIALKGSARELPPKARLVGPPDPEEPVTITIVLRRRPDGRPIPDFRRFVEVPLNRRRPLGSAEFAATYGGHPDEIDQVVSFVRNSGLTVGETNAARRTVIASGTVAQVSRAFAVDLHLYDVDIQAARGEQAHTERFRGREGSVYLPAQLADLVVGVFGLDNRSITKRNMAADPPHTKTLTVPQVAGLYNFPTNSAAGQTIAILSFVFFGSGGYDLADIQKYYSHLPAGFTTPAIRDVPVDASNSAPDIETTQDICIAATAAPGAGIAVYFSTAGQQGWIDVMQRVIHPEVGDPVCSVISCSFYTANGDDSVALAAAGVTTAWLDAVSLAFQDAAVQGITVCIASGDTGADSKIGDGKAHVQYPASDPWVLGCGGTTIGNVKGGSFDEYVWNDSFTISGSSGSGATGGGVSAYFGVPAYQLNANIPKSLNGGGAGRGVPDVAANASWNSGYSPIYCENASAFGYPNPYNGNGTSAAAPLYAGLVAVLNAALGESVGFLNPTLYAFGNTVVQDIDGSAGPNNNSLNGVTGYPAGPGWDACTGLGRLDGQALLAAIRRMGTYQIALIATLAGALD